MRYYDTLNITCSKKVWADTVDIKDVNEFSDVSPISTTTIDLKEYIIDIDELSYDFDEASKENGENQLFFVASDLSFKLSGIENNEYLKTFFGLYENTDRVKWKVLINTGTFTPVIWAGLIHHESINLPKRTSKDSDVITVTALSYEREFKEYNQAKDLPTQGVMFNSTYNVVVGIGVYSRKVKALQQVLGVLFPGVIFTLESGIEEWNLIEDPILHPKTALYGTTNNYVFVKSSYERIWVHGDNRYDWLRKTCNSMGWVFYFYAGGFTIKNRATDIPTRTTLDVKEIDEVDITKYKEVNTFRHILLLDGTIEGGDGTGGNISGTTEVELPYQMRGARMQLISDTNSERITGGNWWNSTTGFALTAFNIGDKFLRYFNEDSNNFNVAYHTKTGASTWSIERRGMMQVDTLRIDTGDTGDQRWLYDVTTGANAPTTVGASLAEPNQWTNYRVRFSGNYGNALCKIETIGTNVYIKYTYSDYVETDLFFDNWMKFYQSRMTRKSSITYTGVITNPLQVFNFTNDTDNEYDGEWVINNMGVDMIKETTRFELQRKLEETDRR